MNSLKTRITRTRAESFLSQTPGVGRKSPLTSTGRRCRTYRSRTTSPPPTKWSNALPVPSSSPPHLPPLTPSSSLLTPTPSPLSYNTASPLVNSSLSNHPKTRWRGPCGTLPASLALPARKQEASTDCLPLPPPFSTSPCQAPRSLPRPRSGCRLSPRWRW